MTNGWKVTAIVFIVITFLLGSLIVWAFHVASEEVKKTNECYWDFCSDYPHAEFYDDVCYCYDYDLTGQYILADSKYMG